MAKTPKKSADKSTKAAAVTALWKSDGLESQENMEIHEVVITSQSNPTEDGVGGMGTKWHITPGEWTGIWRYRSVGGDFMTPEEQKEFLQTLLVWPLYNNPAQGNWKYTSVKVCVRSRLKTQEAVAKKVVFSIDFDSDGDYNAEDLDAVIKKYSEFFAQDNIHTIMNVETVLFHDGKGNPNGDPNNDNAPREVPKSNNKFWMTTMCLHNKLRQVLREEGHKTYIQAGRSMRSTETQEPWLSARTPQEFRRTSLDSLWFGSVRTGGGGNASGDSVSESQESLEE
jgi:hypothetical protein